MAKIGSKVNPTQTSLTTEKQTHTMIWNHRCRLKQHLLPTYVIFGVLTLLLVLATWIMIATTDESDILNYQIHDGESHTPQTNHVEWREIENATKNLSKMRYARTAELRSLVQEIESNIQFSNTTSTDWNPTFSTGYSPHYYSDYWHRGKTPIRIRGNYVCHDRPPSVESIANWTLKLNETNLSLKAREFLHRIQHIGFYNNLYSFFTRTVQTFASPYMHRMNVLWFGNSHTKQIHEAMFVLIDSNNMANLSYSEIRCPPWKNTTIPGCNDSKLYVAFSDKSNDTYLMMHGEKNKTFQNYIQNNDRYIESSQISDLGILIFNLGNGPRYNYSKYFDSDIKYLNLQNKSIIFMNFWFDWGDRFDRDDLLNVIKIDWRYRFMGIRNKTNVIIGPHYCMPGLPDHAMLSINHLINLLNIIDNAFD
eukprot:87863_1